MGVFSHFRYPADHDADAGPVFIAVPGSAAEGEDPWLDRAALLKSAVSLQKGSVTANGVSVAWERFEIKDDTLRLDLPRVVLRDGIGEFQQWRYRVDEIVQWTHNGKAFCLSATLVSFVESGRHGGSIAIKVSAAIFDDNGDGKFTTLEYPRIPINGPQFQPRIPKWILIESKQ